MEMKHKILDGGERFAFCGTPLAPTVKDFWAWAMSRLLADGPRGDLAEFIVNTALGMDMTEPKCGWGACDIIYLYKGRQIGIEVKCSSLLQAWERETPSKPVFSVAGTLNCDIAEYEGGYRFVGRDGQPPRRRSDLYVFCLFANQDRQTADPIALEQWRFYLVSTAVLDQKLGNRRQISLHGLRRLDAVECDFKGLKAAVDGLADDIYHL